MSKAPTDFDRVSALEGVSYGIIDGSESIVLIKGGRGSDHRGHADKYLRMAARLHERLGCSVITASNPAEHESYLTDGAMLRHYAASRGFDAFSLALIGASNGGYQSILLAEKMPEMKSILCINMPLMINFQKAAKLLERMEGVEKIFAYGSLDPSFSYLPFLEIKRIPNSKILRFDGADHNFTGMTKDFIALSDYVSL